MKRVLFLIHDLGSGGAEKVLVNLVNNMDKKKFDITVMTLFDIGENRKYLSKNVKYLSAHKHMMRGNSHFMKLLSPKQLHHMYIHNQFDIEVAYLEGPCARVISGRSENTKTVAWIHGEQLNRKLATASFRNGQEADKCYNRFDRIVYVSNTVKEDFESLINLSKEGIVLYNTVESNKILELSKESAIEIVDDGLTRLVAVGSLKEVKGFDRLLRIVDRLVKEEKPVHLYIIGSGALENHFKQFIKEKQLEKFVTLLGYQSNPYKYVSKCDLFVCSSHREGFSTAATEALIVGTPVCTVEVSGMKEMLGENNEYGWVTSNNEESLYEGIVRLLYNPELLIYYKKQAEKRGMTFSSENTVNAVEKMFISL